MASYNAPSQKNHASVTAEATASLPMRSLCRQSFMMPCQYESGSKIPSLVIYNQCGHDLSFCLYVSSEEGNLTDLTLQDATLLRIIKIRDDSSAPIHVGWRNLYRRHSNLSLCAPSVILLSSAKDSDACLACPMMPLHAFTCKDVFMLSASHVPKTYVLLMPAIVIYLLMPCFVF
jgi:hypothetical protein